MDRMKNAQKFWSESKNRSYGNRVGGCAFDSSGSGYGLVVGSCDHDDESPSSQKARNLTSSEYYQILKDYSPQCYLVR